MTPMELKVLNIPTLSNQLKGTLVQSRVPRPSQIQPHLAQTSLMLLPPTPTYAKAPQLNPKVTRVI